MREYWSTGEATVAEIVQALEGRTHWKPRTVQTLVNRLVRKQALGFTKRGREHVYRPLVAEADCVMEASQSFVQRLFGGRLAPLLACFVESGQVKAEDMEQLRKILDEHRKP